MKRPLTVIRNSLLERGETISVAESVTAGNIQASLSVAKNAIDFFPGGITTYSIDQKVMLLNVKRRHAERVNCVSRQVVSEMAKAVSKLFNSHWAAAITGYASPVPEENIKELFAWVAVCHNGKIVLTQHVRLKKLSPQMAQLAYAKKVLQLLAGCIARNR